MIITLALLSSAVLNSKSNSSWLYDTCCFDVFFFPLDGLLLVESSLEEGITNGGALGLKLVCDGMESGGQLPEGPRKC